MDDETASMFSPTAAQVIAYEASRSPRDLVEDFVDEWHDDVAGSQCDLHEWLGWTYEEYWAWAELRASIIAVRGVR